MRLCRGLTGGSQSDLFWVPASGSWSFWALPFLTQLAGYFSPQCHLCFSSGSYLWCWFQAGALYVPSFQQVQYWWFLWPSSRLISPENYLTYLLLSQIDYTRWKFIYTQPSCITSPFIDACHSHTMKDKVNLPIHIPVHPHLPIHPFINFFFY